MKRLFPVLAIFSLSFAAPPVQEMSLTMVGVDYSALWRGEEITNSNVPAHENTHMLNVRWSPVKHLALTGGIGAARYTVDEYKGSHFKGTFGIAPSFGLDLFSPAFLKEKLRVTGGASGYYLYSQNGDKTHVYSGLFVNPQLGIIASVNRTTDIEAGARGHLIAGSMREKGFSPRSFSNPNVVRFYFSAMVHSPSEGVYFMFDVDASPKFDHDWSNGPAESSIGFAIGYLYGKKEREAESTIDKQYPEYRNLERKREEMLEEIQ